MGGDGVMASKFLYNQAIEDSNQINQSPKFSISDWFGGWGNNNQVQDINYPNKLQNESFSNLDYEDRGLVHGPLGHSGLQSIMPHDLGQNWIQNNAINYKSTYPQAPFQPNMLDVAGTGQLPVEGITAANAAQKQDFSFPSFLLNMANYRNPLRKGAANYNPALQGQIDDLNQINFLSGDQGNTGPYQITGGPLAGKNLVSMFGTNDYDEMLAQKADWFQKRKDADKGFSQKNWDAVIAEQEARASEKKAREYDGARSFDPSGPTQASIRRERPDKSGSGHRSGFTDPGKDSYGPHKRAQGGYMRQGYSRGGRVGILSVF